MAYVYRHIRVDKNEPFYIGIGADDNYKRAYDKYRGRRSDAWYRVVDKTMYQIEILFDNVDLEFAKQKEIEFISIHGRRDLGKGTLVNMTDGGDGLFNKVYTKEYRQKLSESAKKRKPQPQLQKIIEWRKNNKVFTEETRKKLSASLKGKPKSEAHKRKGSEAKRGNKNPMYGVKGVLNSGFKGYIYVYKDGKFIEKYEGICDCATKMNLKATNISRVVLGRRNHYHGYVFKRENA